MYRVNTVLSSIVLLLQSGSVQDYYNKDNDDDMQLVLFCFQDNTIAIIYWYTSLNMNVLPLDNSNFSTLINGEKCTSQLKYERIMPMEDPRRINSNKTEDQFDSNPAPIKEDSNNSYDDDDDIIPIFVPSDEVMEYDNDTIYIMQPVVLYQVKYEDHKYKL